MRARNRGLYYVSSCALSSRASSTAAAVERNRVQYVFIGAARIQLNADVVQARRRYMTFIHAFLVSAMEIHHVRVVTAVVESNNIQLVFMGAVRMRVNVDVVQARSGFMTFIHAFLVSAMTIHHVGVVMAMVESNKTQQVFMGVAGMMVYVDMVQAGRGHQQTQENSIVVIVDIDFIEKL